MFQSRNFSLRTFLIIATAAILFSGCKAFNLRVANNYYDEFAYSRAILKYEKVLRKEFDPEAASRLADSYLKTGNSFKAEIWYRRLSKSPLITFEDRFNFSKVLMENGKYEEAKESLKEYLQLNPNDKEARKLSLVCDSVHLFYEDTTIYTISPLPINGEAESNFSPVFYRDGIVYVSDRPSPGKSKVRSPWTGKEYLDLFYTSLDGDRWIEPQLLKGDINGLYDEGPASFSPDFSIIYFTRMDYTGKSVEKNQKDVSLLKLFSGTLTGNTWKLTGPLPFNNPEYSVGHPAVSPDGNTLYFVSDMPWGYGGTDIYRSSLVNGKWSEPKNLGANVNTEGNEMFPFISGDSVLYFSSNGHFGLGGLDVYSSFWDGEKWSKAENLQYPVNSSKDDFGYIVDKSDKSGFFTSNREKNRDRIFGFSKNPPLFEYEAVVKDSKTSKAVSAYTLTVLGKNPERKVLAEVKGSVGRVKLTPNTDYTVELKAKGYYATTTRFSTIGKRKSMTIHDTLNVVKIELNKPVVLKNIRFNKKEEIITEETGKALDSLAVVMKQNPELEIEILSHTDSRGSFTDNLALSKRRADLIRDYLIKQGISIARLMPLGYGEGKLLNQCRDGIFCIEEDHVINNRIEIKVTSTSSK